MAEQRKRRTAQQELEIVLAGMRGDRSVRDVCRERDEILEGGKAALAGKDERRGEKEPQKKIRELERALGRKTCELEIAGEAVRGWG